MAEIIVATRPLCGECEEVKRLLGSVAYREIDATRYDGLAELAFRELVNVAKEKGLPILIVNDVPFVGAEAKEMAHRIGGR